MAEDENKDSNVKATIDAITGLVAAIPIYQDTIQPAAKQVGTSLETVTKAVNIALAPIKMIVWGYEKIEDFLTSKVSEKLKNVPEENITTPPASIAGPAVEALRFVGEDVNLRELYANLLASAMNSITQHLVHPSYVEIIKNLSSNEAELLQLFIVKRSYPIIDVVATFENQKGEKIVLKNFASLKEATSIPEIEILSSYIDNLNRLGITEIPEDRFLINELVYDKLENEKIVQLIKKYIEENNGKISITKKILRLTNFGQLFINNVVKDIT